MIRVIKGTVKADGETYIPGDVIIGLSEKDEAALIADKVAEEWGYAPVNSVAEEEVGEEQEEVLQGADESDGGSSVVIQEDDPQTEGTQLEEVQEAESQPESNEVIIPAFDAEAYFESVDTVKPAAKRRK